MVNGQCQWGKVCIDHWSFFIALVIGHWELIIAA